MPHYGMEDRLKWSVWITGQPGVGFNSVGERLGGAMTDKFGYRSTHLRPHEWNISLEVCKYRITDPEIKNPYFYGFGQNYAAISRLPWRLIIVMHATEEELVRRVLEYRHKTPDTLKDGRSDSWIAQHVCAHQRKLMEYFRTIPIAKFLDTTSLSVREEVRRIRAEKFDQLPEVDASAGVSPTPVLPKQGGTRPSIHSLH